MRQQQRLLTTLLLVIVVFVIGVIIGNTWESSESRITSKILKQSELDTESFIVEQELFESFETNCGLAEQRINALSEELWKLGKVLGTKDAQEKLGSSDYNFLKRKYHLMQIRTYILTKKLQVDCGQKIDIILYYYDLDDPLSEQQGKILDQLVASNDIHVFAIEYQYSNELKFLEDYYEVRRTPTIIVNFEYHLVGLVPIEKIIPLLHG